ncbi:MAG: cation transporter [Vampirovibrio sp.]|nr:cation transporter [Vampirovibrio sp.]
MSETCCNQPCGSTLKTETYWLKIAFILVGLTIVYNIAEAVIAVLTGYSAESIALVGFGFDSLIEVSAALMVLWRLIEQVKHQNDEAVEKAETIVHRFVGGTFLLLATYIGIDSIISLSQQSKPEETLIGIIIAALSLIIMPLLAFWKIKAAKAINSKALQAEAKETIACSILSLILLVGLALNALFGWWWADPVAALVMIPWLIKEGIAGLKGEGCCG